MNSSDAKKDGPVVAGGPGPKKELKQEPATPGNNPNMRGGRGGRGGGGRGGGRGGFMNQQGGNKRDSPAPGALRGNISFEVGLPALALFLQTLGTPI